MYRIIMNLDSYLENRNGTICFFIGMVLAMAVFVFLVGPVHNLVKAKVVKLCGDDWVEEAGYFSLNPANSFHWIGAFSVLLVFMGFTKRVRYRKRYLDRPFLGAVMISVSGILTYFLCFLFFAFLVSLLGSVNSYGMTNPSVMPETELPFWGCVFHVVFLAVFFLTRICLYSAFFNLIPLAPMDMGELLFAFIGKHWSEQIKKNEMLISVGLFLLAFLSLGLPNSFIVQTSLDIITFFQNGFSFIINIFI